MIIGRSITLDFFDGVLCSCRHVDDVAVLVRLHGEDHFGCFRSDSYCSVFGAAIDSVTLYSCCGAILVFKYTITEGTGDRLSVFTELIISCVNRSFFAIFVFCPHVDFEEEFTGAIFNLGIHIFFVYFFVDRDTTFQFVGTLDFGKVRIFHCSSGFVCGKFDIL